MPPSLPIAAPTKRLSLHGRTGKGGSIDGFREIGSVCPMVLAYGLGLLAFLVFLVLVIDSVSVRQPAVVASRALVRARALKGGPSGTLVVLSHGLGFLAFL